MLNPSAPAEAEQPSQTPKEMLTCQTTNGKQLVRINYSSLNLIQTCLRKAHYSLNLGLKAREESTALAFGSAVHEGLAYWYQLPSTERLLPASLSEQADCYSFGQGLDEVAGHGALEAIRHFCKARYSILSQLPETDKRSLQSGIRILKAHFKHYANDGFTVYRDSNGPIIERRCEFPIYESESLQVNYFGTVDCILQHATSKVIAVTDHKTTSALGQEFYNRCSPNHQYTGYVWLAQKALGIDTKMFCINGLQTAKTKTEFARQITERTEENFQELREAVVENVKRWLTATEQTKFPMTAPDPCSMYGGCGYRKLCEVPDSLRQQIIKIEYK